MNGWSDEEFMENMVYKPWRFIKSLFRPVRKVQKSKDEVTIYADNLAEEDAKSIAKFYSNARGWTSAINEEVEKESEREKKERWKNEAQNAAADYRRRLSEFTSDAKAEVNTEANDMNDYEYSSDGKRMCFVNIHNGHTVYHEDPLFHDLKRQMLGEK